MRWVYLKILPLMSMGPLSCLYARPVDLLNHIFQMTMVNAWVIYCTSCTDGQKICKFFHDFRLDISQGLIFFFFFFLTREKANHPIAAIPALSIKRLGPYFVTTI